MIRSLRMLWPLLRRPSILVLMPFLSFIAITWYNMKFEENIWSAALGFPLLWGVWILVMREGLHSFRVLWIAPEFRERSFQFEIAMVMVMAVFVGALHFMEHGLFFAVEAFALALLGFVMLDGDHWRNHMKWPAIVLLIVLVTGLAKPDWANTVLESHPLPIAVALFGAVAVLRSGNRLTEVARRLTNNPAAGLFDPTDAAIADGNELSEAARHGLLASESVEQPSLWQASLVQWMRASHYEHGSSLLGYLPFLVIVLVMSLAAESNFLLSAYVFLGILSLRLRLPSVYPLSRRMRRNVHFALSQVSLFAGVIVFGAGALILRFAESLWGGEVIPLLGPSGLFVTCIVIIGAAPIVQFPRKRRTGRGVMWGPLGKYILCAILLHFAVLLSFFLVRLLVSGLELLWYAIAFAVIGQIVNWNRLRRYFTNEDLI